MQPEIGRRSSSASSAMRRYVVSLPPATLSMPAGAPRVDGLTPCLAVLAAAARQHAQPGIRRARMPLRSSGAGSRATAASASTCSISASSAVDAPSRVAVVERVGRTEQEHALPRDGEAHPHLVVRDRQRRRPARCPRVEQHVHALAQPDRRPRARVLEPAHASSHGPEAFTTARAETAIVAAVGDTSAPATRPRSSRSADDLGVVRDGSARVGRARERWRASGGCRSSSSRRRGRTCGGPRARRSGTMRRARPGRRGRSAGRARASSRARSRSGRRRAGTGPRS